MPATCQPGTAWMYGHGPDVAAYLIERAGALRLDEYLRANVFARAGVAPDEDPEGLGLAAVGGFNAHDGGDVCYGGHGAYVTVRAFVSVLESVLRDDRRVLSHEMVREMFRPQLEGTAEAALQAALEGPAGPAFGCGTSGSGRNWGLGGLLVGEDGDGGLGKGAMIWGWGHNTVWFIDPTNGVCGIASPQLLMPGDISVATQLKSAFRSHLGPVLKAAEISSANVRAESST
ncbi:hypothetical protein EHS25_005468 [Saitozyma podzolica]|uniref:Beta-lactamase-related domain-containing protein n=1 Tax=Saitozyma podzolica TaxID=1890683 RepID=A0A427XYG3_9TREE|nr:hypothetical protein EHS25_005468 [Saitozyma podzolica]